MKAKLKVCQALLLTGFLTLLADTPQAVAAGGENEPDKPGFCQVSRRLEPGLYEITGNIQGVTIRNRLLLVPKKAPRPFTGRVAFPYSYDVGKGFTLEAAAVRLSDVCESLNLKGGIEVRYAPDGDSGLPIVFRFDPSLKAGHTFARVPSGTVDFGAFELTAFTPLQEIAFEEVAYSWSIPKLGFDQISLVNLSSCLGAAFEGQGVFTRLPEALVPHADIWNFEGTASNGACQMAFNDTLIGPFGQNFASSRGTIQFALQGIAAGDTFPTLFLTAGPGAESFEGTFKLGAQYGDAPTTQVYFKRE